jgi:hypothetical protein
MHGRRDEKMKRLTVLFVAIFMALISGCSSAPANDVSANSVSVIDSVGSGSETKKNENDTQEKYQNILDYAEELPADGLTVGSMELSEQTKEDGTSYLEFDVLLSELNDFDDLMAYTLMLGVQLNPIAKYSYENDTELPEQIVVRYADKDYQSDGEAFEGLMILLLPPLSSDALFTSVLVVRDTFPQKEEVETAYYNLLGELDIEAQLEKLK